MDMDNSDSGKEMIKPFEMHVSLSLDPSEAASFPVESDWNGKMCH